ncbi:hypothetical protein DKX38_003800 [Salix brachista]|uniref:Uncharacterized protein n=1 Tax=Salix brachista TaxID=2182728 RepID=A0A5N5NBK8_9ROSI|nr:hypothetical protein DKX38_003800 [Salix brachista]
MGWVAFGGGMPAMWQFAVVQVGYQQWRGGWSVGSAEDNPNHLRVVLAIMLHRFQEITSEFSFCTSYFIGGFKNCSGEEGVLVPVLLPLPMMNRFQQELISNGIDYPVKIAPKL